MKALREAKGLTPSFGEIKGGHVRGGCATSPVTEGEMWMYVKTNGWPSETYDTQGADCTIEPLSWRYGPQCEAVRDR